MLPCIKHKIEWFHLEASSMERILLSGNYSNLSGHGIYNLTKDDALHYFTELHIKIHCAQDCLHLLDGRFNQLRVFNVKIQSPFSSISKISKDKQLNLRYFSLSCMSKIYFYDTIVLPLLHRMSNLEQLRLYFNCSRKQSFVDENDLKTNILIH